MRQPPLLQRLRAKKRSQTLIIGLTWYTEETWLQVKSTASDPKCFEESFIKWKAMAVKAQREFQRSGVRAIECKIDPQAFAAWCALNEQENNSTSRGEYVSEVLSVAHA
jgi:hypothetical protein